MAALFDRDKSVTSRHLRNIYREGELEREATVAFFATVQDEGGRQVLRQVEYYNLDAIISVGYRVNSRRGTQFRIWATQVLRDHLIKGYTVNARRLEELQKTVRVVARAAERPELTTDEARALLNMVAAYLQHLDEAGQIDFKGKAKAFLPTYNFLSSILPYTNAEWEKLSIFLEFLVPKLPAAKEEDLAKGILAAIDMDSYRVEKQASMRIALPNAEAEIKPVPATGEGHKPEPRLDRISNVIEACNDQFGNMPWTDAGRGQNLIAGEIPPRVAPDSNYQNVPKYPDKQNARIEHDKARKRVMTALLRDDTELFKQFSDNEGLWRWLTDTVFALTYGEPGGTR